MEKKKKYLTWENLGIPLFNNSNMETKVKAKLVEFGLFLLILYEYEFDKLSFN